MARSTGRSASNHRLSLRYNGHRNDSPYNNSSIGGLFLVDRTYNFVDRSHGGAAQLVSVLSANAVNELRFQIPFRSQAQNRFEATGTGPAITIPGVANFGNSLDVGFRYEETTPGDHRQLQLEPGHSRAEVRRERPLDSRHTGVEPTIANYTFPSIAAYLAAKAGSDPAWLHALRPDVRRAVA